MIGGAHLSDSFQVRANVFIAAVMDVLNWAADAKRVRCSERQLRGMLAFDAVGEIVQYCRLPISKGRCVRWFDIADVPDAVLAPLRAYLVETAGFDPQRPFDKQRFVEPVAPHAEVLRSLGPDLMKYLA